MNLPTAMPAARSAQDEPARLAEATWSLYQQGEVTVVVDGLLAAGPRSRIWRLDAIGPDGARQYAVKWFRPRYRLAGEPVAREYLALVSLTRALGRLRTGRYLIRCPVPVRAWRWGYVMSAVPGRRLDDALARRLLPAAEHPRIARDLVAALAAFHGEHGGPHGGFQPGNVLFGPGAGLHLLHPAAAPAESCAWPGPGTPPDLAVDIAYWAFCTALRAPRLAVRRPWAVAECFRFAAELGRAAVEHSGDPRLAGQFDRCLAGYWARLRRRGVQHAAALAAGRLHGPGRHDRGSG
jgi:hypothetical protein